PLTQTARDRDPAPSRPPQVASGRRAVEPEEEGSPVLPCHSRWRGLRPPYRRRESNPQPDRPGRPPPLPSCGLDLLVTSSPAPSTCRRLITEGDSPWFDRSWPRRLRRRCSLALSFPPAPRLPPPRARRRRRAVPASMSDR